MPRSQLAVAGLGAATFGALLAGYSAFRPVRDALIVGGNPESIPWLFTATFVAVSIASPIWGARVATQPRRAVTIAFHGFAVCELAFFVVLRANVSPLVVGRVFYVWSAVFNLFVVSVFWSLLADLLGPATARRLYGPIAAGGTVGGIVGPLVTKLLVGTVGVAGILLVSAVLLELAVLGTVLLRHVAVDVAREAEDPPVAGGALSGLAHVAHSPYLASLVGYVLCTSCAATFVYLAQQRIAHDAGLTGAHATEFFATIDVYVNVATLALQLLIAAPLIGWLGPGIVLCVLPLVQAAGLGVLALAPSLAALVVVQTLGRSTTHGLTRPARELLFTVLPRDDKYRAKNVIDVVVYRFGDLGASWLNRGLAAVGSTAVAIAAIPLAAGWIALALVLGTGFQRRHREHRSA